ncbi:hypothetical protein E2C01_055308 [Portunus trituberculatus]|uniref:Uncharacterized protein n=1 Tax=Portunus trituberculatus TaxID=210409 RepID=A0A5B7GMD9_PORTR|nr:hypothetical protein [Portunus trituberculatus]
MQVQWEPGPVGAWLAWTTDLYPSLFFNKLQEFSRLFGSTSHPNMAQYCRNWGKVPGGDRGEPGLEQAPLEEAVTATPETGSVPHSPLPSPPTTTQRHTLYPNCINTATGAVGHGKLSTRHTHGYTGKLTAYTPVMTKNSDSRHATGSFRGMGCKCGGLWPHLWVVSAFRHLIRASPV